MKKERKKNQQLTASAHILIVVDIFHSHSCLHDLQKGGGVFLLRAIQASLICVRTTVSVVWTLGDIGHPRK